MKHFPFTIFDKDTKPYVRVEYRGEQKEFVRVLCVLMNWALLLMTPHYSPPKRSPP